VFLNAQRAEAEPAIELRGAKTKVAHGRQHIQSLFHFKIITAIVIAAKVIKSLSDVGGLGPASPLVPPLTDGNFGKKKSKTVRFAWNWPVHRFRKKPASSTGF
jgi:hypothetical protein